MKTKFRYLKYWLRNNWKKFIPLLLMLPAIATAQFEPPKVHDMIKDSLDFSKRFDTITIENHAYIYSITHLSLREGDSTAQYVDVKLVEIKKLYTDPYKVAGVAYFAVNMSAFVFLPQLQIHSDKYLHGAVGYVIGAGANALIYHYTKRKWLAFVGGIVAGAAVGAGKEWIYDKNFGGVTSVNDFLATGVGAIDGSLGATIVIGHKHFHKTPIQP